MYIVLKRFQKKKSVSISYHFPLPKHNQLSCFSVISSSISFVGNKLLMLFLDLLISNIFYQ